MFSGIWSTVISFTSFCSVSLNRSLLFLLLHEVWNSVFCLLLEILCLSHLNWDCSIYSYIKAYIWSCTNQLCLHEQHQAGTEPHKAQDSSFGSLYYALCSSWLCFCSVISWSASSCASLDVPAVSSLPSYYWGLCICAALSPCSMFTSAMAESFTVVSAPRALGQWLQWNLTEFPFTFTAVRVARMTTYDLVFHDFFPLPLEDFLRHYAPLYYIIYNVQSMFLAQFFQD